MQSQQMQNLPFSSYTAAYPGFSHDQDTCKIKTKTEPYIPFSENSKIWTLLLVTFKDQNPIEKLS